MFFIQQMLHTHPRGETVRSSLLTECIAACFECAQACTACADACLAESDVAELVHCIHLNHDCADICEVTGRILSRQASTSVELQRLQLESCVTACRACGLACDRHADRHEHCRFCAEACRRCETLCNRFLQSVPAAA